MNNKGVENIIRIASLEFIDEVNQMLDDKSYTYREIVDFIRLKGVIVTANELGRYQLARSLNGRNQMKENWEQIISLSMEQSLLEAEKHHEFIEAGQLILELFEKVDQCLTLDEKHSLEDAFVTQTNVLNKAAYQKGLQDGKFLFSMMNGEE